VATAEVIMTNVSAISMDGIETLPIWQPQELPAEYAAQFGEVSKCAVELMQRFDFEGFLKRVHPDGIAHAIAKDRSFEECVREFVCIVRKLNFLAQLNIRTARALWETYVPVRIPYLTFLDPSMEAFEAKFHDMKRRISAAIGGERTRLENSNRAWLDNYAASRVLFLPLFASTPRAAFVGDTISPGKAPE
jgi:hypothetical protein